MGITLLSWAGWIVISGFAAYLIHGFLDRLDPAEDEFEENLAWGLSGFIGLFWPIVLVVAVIVLVGKYFLFRKQGRERLGKENTEEVLHGKR